MFKYCMGSFVLCPKKSGKIEYYCQTARLAASILMIISLLSSTLSAQDNLRKAFDSPPFNAKPWMYWYWMNGSVTKEGIIADMKGFHEAGIGGVNQMDIGIWPQGAVTYHSKEWFELIRVALTEAKKYGIRMNLSSPGWSSSGGPWVTPEMSMKHLTWSELRVNRLNNSPIIIGKPFNNLNYYQDIAVLAFPSPEGDNWLFKDLHPQILDTTGTPVPDAERLYDSDLGTTANVPAKFDIVFENEVAVNSVFIRPDRFNALNATILAWDKKTGAYIKLAKFRACDSGPIVEQVGDVTFPKTKSKKFRIAMDPGPVKELFLCGGYRINDWVAKIGTGIYDMKNPAKSFLGYNNPEKGDIIPQRAIFNLTDKMGPDGKLNWTVPEGEWTILRIGYTTNGAKIYPPPAGGDGLECDKLSTEGTVFNYQHTIKPVLDSVGPELSKVIECQHIDSYEAGWQNWTQNFADEFKTRCGYDIIKYLPIVTGRVVESEAFSEKFLWDFRHAISDMIIDNHLGGAAKAGKKDGLLLSNEPINYPADDLKAGGALDYPMMEFWTPMTKIGANRLRFHPIFAGRINGKKVIGSEAFSSAAPEIRWNEHPYSLKALGDYMYCAGITRFTLHVSAHQPFIGEHFAPGMTVGGCGVHFDRGNTWWEHGAKEFMQYLTRTQSVLQQGEHLADVLYFIGSETPFNDRWPDEWGLKKYEPELPYGYDFDACSEDVLLKLITKNSLLELPFGKNYKYLVLPAHGWITTTLLKKVLELVKSGATVVSSPMGYHSPSLSDDRLHVQLERDLIIRELWGEFPASKGERKVGNGRVIWGTGFQTILANDQLIPDFSYQSSDSLLLNSVHRYTHDEEIYFIANGSQNDGWATCRFRVKIGIPYFWDAYKGTLEPCKIYTQKGDYFEIPVYFDPSGSVFVVFYKTEKKPDNIVSVAHNGADITNTDKRTIEFIGSENTAKIYEPGIYDIFKADGKKQQLSVSDIPDPIPFTSPWTLNFPAGWGAPAQIELPKLISYTDYPHEGVKYFSGTAMYQTSVNVPANALSKNKLIYLDLGQVEVIAKIKINGMELGTYWKPPFIIDITSAITPGNNQVEITVTNLWANRMIGDEQYPNDAAVENSWPQWVIKNEPRPEPRRLTFTPLRAWAKTDALLPSGLLGPVTLNIVPLIKIKTH